MNPKILLLLPCILTCSFLPFDDKADPEGAEMTVTYARPGHITPPEGFEGLDEDEDGKIEVTEVATLGNVGWAIDYNIMFIAKSMDGGKTWRHVDTEPHDLMMPTKLYVLSPDCTWVRGYYTDETIWDGVPHSVLVTHDGGDMWHSIPHLVDWLDDLEVLSANHAIVSGRVRPEDWPDEQNAEFDENELPVSRFETRDGGRTFEKL